MPRCATWNWPEDTRRQVMIPHGHLLFVRVPYAFSATLKEDERTVCMETAVQMNDGHWGAFLSAPPYAGEGATAQRRTLHTAVYTSKGIQRHDAVILILPPGDRASMITRLTGRQVRDMEGAYAVLSNGAGAMAQVRMAWGDIRSQYDCLLAVNPHPNVPVDKMIFWTRCRAWLNYRGYSQEINKTCLTHFDADPAGRFAEWFFTVPCGLGQWVPISFRLEMEKHANRIHLVIMRHVHGESLKSQDDITIILRPDMEWRSFHETTKAFKGLEGAWSGAMQPQAKGFSFTPAERVTLAMNVTRGHFSSGHEWLYMVPHPEEQSRGLEAAGDLFSPGWFELPLKGGEVSTVTAWSDDEWTLGSLLQSQSHGAAEKPAISRLLPLAEGVADALALYVVKRDKLSTVIAGYPWFLDWGRDTLIALRGLIAAGNHDLALNILSEFARREKNGTLPNMIRGEDDGNRETSDAPLWLCVAAGELMTALGDDARVLNMRCGSRSLCDVLLSIVSHYRDGMSQGIYMDKESALIYSPPHYTWMDTNYPAATPREGYPIDIQALWIAALYLVAHKIDLSWVTLAERATDSVRRYFETPEGWLADCLRAKPGVSAEEAEQEDTLRPNQLLTVTLDVLHNRAMERAIVRACECLLVPGAIRSLADRPVKTDMSVLRDGVLLNDPHHPYQGRYEGDEDTRRKPAYHNGTAWTWPFPQYVEALYTVYG
jgi:predicted glycogen debranching enzyme